jgi:multicomponent Na+:H+ antiporter subunit F
MGRPGFVDMALAYALINFIGVLAVLEFFFDRRSRQLNEPAQEVLVDDKTSGGGGR